jgi:hypothetical protein
MKRLNEVDINRIVKKIINEDIDRTKMLEIVDDVINRLKEHGMEYYRELDSLNFKYPTERYKRLDPPKRGDIEPPKGVRVSRSAFPDEI